MYLNVSTRPRARARQIRVLCLTHLSDKADVGLSESPQKSTGPSPRTPPGAALLLSPVGSAEPVTPVGLSLPLCTVGAGRPRPVFSKEAGHSTQASSRGPKPGKEHQPREL